MRAKTVNENFKEESDPIKDMGIGYIEHLLQNKHFFLKKAQDAIPPEWPDWIESIGGDPEKIDDMIVIFSEDFKKPIYDKIKKYLIKKAWKIDKALIVAGDEFSENENAELLIVNKKYLV